MSFDRKNAVGDQWTGTGAGTPITLDGVAIVGMRNAATAFAGGGVTVTYRIQNASNTEWEENQGTYTVATNALTRGTPSASSASGSLVTFSAGTKVVIFGPQVGDFVDTVQDLGNSGTSTQTCSLDAADYFKITATGNFTVAFSNWLLTGNLSSLILEAVNFGAFTVTWPTINWIKTDGTTTTSISTYLTFNTGRTSLQSSGTDFFVLWTRDGGTTIYGKLV